MENETKTTSLPDMVDTPYGRLRFWATSGTHAGFATKGDVNVAPKPDEADNALNINGVLYTFRVDLHRGGTPPPYRYLDGEWYMTGDSILSHRLDDWAAPLSAAARKKIYDVLLPSLIHFLGTTDAQKVLRQAEKQRLEQNVDAALNAIDRAREAEVAALIVHEDALVALATFLNQEPT